MSDVKIERLTPEQGARLPEFAAKWRAIGLSTDPADRPRAERAIRLAYEVGGLKPPAHILWTPSPLAAGLAQIALTGKPFAASVSEAIGDSLKPVLGDLNWETANPAGTDSDREWFRDSVRAAADSAAGTAYGSVVAAMVQAMIVPAIGTPVKEAIVDAIHSEISSSINSAVEYSVLHEVRRSLESDFNVAFRTEMQAAMGHQFMRALEAGGMAEDDSPSNSTMLPPMGFMIPASIAPGSGGVSLPRTWSPAGSSIAFSPTIFSGSSMSMRMRSAEETAAERLIGQFGYGQHDAPLLALYDYFRQVCDLSIQTEKVLDLMELAQSASWWLPYANICWVSERPVALCLDERNRLYNETGPALAYPDGFSIYAVHGVRLPEYIIERPGEITSEKIQAENNAEVRRVMLSKYGEGRYLEAIGAKAIHQDEYGQLFRVEFWGDEPLVIVRVIDTSTQQPYFLRVDPNAYGGRAGREARAAVASTWRYADGTMVFARPEDYVLTAES